MDVRIQLARKQLIWILSKKPSMMRMIAITLFPMLGTRSGLCVSYFSQLSQTFSIMREADTQKQLINYRNIRFTVIHTYKKKPFGTWQFSKSGVLKLIYVQYPWDVMTKVRYFLLLHFQFYHSKIDQNTNFFKLPSAKWFFFVQL